MRRVILSAISDRPASLRRPVFLLFAGLLAALAAPGCGHKEKADHTSVAEPPTVQLIQPQVRNIVRVVGQPSFIESYERSSVYPKMNAYILKWIVDIGDKVKKGDVLATLFVPELVEDHGTKKATVVLDQERIALAKVVVEVAKANVKAAEARLEEARAELASYQAEVERWDSEAKRLQHEVDRGVVSPQDHLQAINRWKASIAARQAAKATVMKADDELVARRAALSKAEVDVRVAEADLKVAESEEKRLKAWVDYLVLPTWSLPVALGYCRADLRGRPHRHRPHLRRHPRARRQLRPHRLQGHRARQGVPRPADPRHRHAHVLGAERQEPHAPRRDRPAQPRQPDPAGDVWLRQGEHRAARRVGAAGVGAHAHREDHLAHRREDVLLGVRERPRETDRGGDGAQRRRVDRGHQSPAPGGGRRRGQLDADRRDGAGDLGRPVDPRRWQSREGRSGDGDERGESRACQPTPGPFETLSNVDQFRAFKVLVPVSWEFLEPQME